MIYSGPAKRTFTILPRLPQMRAALRKLIREFRQLQQRVGGPPAQGAGGDEGMEDF